MPTDEQLLAEVEDLLRVVPNELQFVDQKDEAHSWLGRSAAVMDQWSTSKSLLFQGYVGMIIDPVLSTYRRGRAHILVMLNQCRSDLRMRSIGPTNSLIESGRVFDYFDEIRAIIELASQDAFFIDPYLDADFVSRYLPHIGKHVEIRLLTSEKLRTLLPAVDLFTEQNNVSVQVRSSAGLHDRYVFIDRSSCYQSGASFKDGAKTAPTTLTQITDAFSAVWDTYNKLWSAAQVER